MSRARQQGEKLISITEIVLSGGLHFVAAKANEWDRNPYGGVCVEDVAIPGYPGILRAPAIRIASTPIASMFLAYCKVARLWDSENRRGKSPENPASPVTRDSDCQSNS